MQSRAYKMYSASDFGKSEVELQRLFRLQCDDAKSFFTSITKPRLPMAVIGKKR
jgi:hypothetical protein